MIGRLLLIGLLLLGKSASGQFQLLVAVTDSAGTPVHLAEVFCGRNSTPAVTDRSGQAVFHDLAPGTYRVEAFAYGHSSAAQKVSVPYDTEKAVRIVLTPFAFALDAAEVSATDRSPLQFMRSTAAGAIFVGMKSQAIQASDAVVNVSTNNSRQFYGKVPGLNIWESDGAGIQLGIGGRGLSPDRTSHFNVRQNGFDISADPLGYPESYYTPPLEALERVELVRGAAALQYGTQFGGLLNFQFKRGEADQPLKVMLRQTVGTYGLRDTVTSPLASSNTALSVAGSRKRMRYFGFAQLKAGDGWRPNAGYNVLTAHFNAQFDLGQQAELGLEFTHMNYLAQQPGGLLDRQFERSPRDSFRNRNWFGVEWNLAAIHYKQSFGPRFEWHSTAYGLLAARSALGFLGDPGRIDFETEPRDLIDGKFRHGGLESRLLLRGDWRGRLVLGSIGVRLFQGESHTRQGAASNSSDPDFSFSSVPFSIASDYRFPNQNMAAFGQWAVPVTDRLTLVPGVRYEWIDTQADGRFTEVLLDGAGNVLEDSTFTDQRSRRRGFALWGVSLSWKPVAGLELYANAVQNYRAINFSDIQIQGLGIAVDPAIKDERGATFDLGFRGKLQAPVTFDVSVFHLKYNDRIGSFNIVVSDPVLVQRVVRLRTNIADASIAGVEAVVTADFIRWFRPESKHGLEVYVNASWIDGRYANASEVFGGNRVELVPAYTIRSGLTWKRGSWRASGQLSYVAEQFTDATNATETSNAIDGIIPSQTVLDITGHKDWRHWGVSVNVNNALNTIYFTRRAAGYPGPGILPSDGRSVYVTLTFNW